MCFKTIKDLTFLQSFDQHIVQMAPQRRGRSLGGAAVGTAETGKQVQAPPVAKSRKTRTSLKGNTEEQVGKTANK
jgi:hypothetical protein